MFGVCKRFALLEKYSIGSGNCINWKPSVSLLDCSPMYVSAKIPTPLLLQKFARFWLRLLHSQLNLLNWYSLGLGYLFLHSNRVFVGIEKILKKSPRIENPKYLDSFKGQGTVRELGEYCLVRDWKAKNWHIPKSRWYMAFQIFFLIQRQHREIFMHRVKHTTIRVAKSIVREGKEICRIDLTVIKSWVMVSLKVAS